MMNKVKLDKLPTGVPGLDQLLYGGISKYAFVVLMGAPGSGKTTLAHQMMFSLAAENRKALFFTIMGEAPLKMLRYQQQYSFFEPTKVGSCIKYVNLADDLQSSGFEGVLERILKEVESFQPELIFVDSFKSVIEATKETKRGTVNLQYFVQQLGLQLSTWQATTFLIGEYADSSQEENPIFTVADGIIHLSQELDQNAMVRKIRVVKMRGSQHMTGLHTFRMTNDGLEIYPRLLTNRSMQAQPNFADRSSKEHLSTGCVELDGMLGGGIPSGYSIIVAGPSGCGKTVLATSFLAAGAKAEEHGIIFSFEHYLLPESNIPLQNMIDAGSVTVIHPWSLDLSIEELVTELVEAIDRTHATRLVIDSLTAMELVLASQFRENFQESLLRMLSSLHARGVTVFLIKHVADLESQMSSPSSYLVGGVISMRYVEVNNQLISVISCPKLRGCAHSKEARAFKVFSDRMELGEIQLQRT